MPAPATRRPTSPKTSTPAKAAAPAKDAKPVKTAKPAAAKPAAPAKRKAVAKKPAAPAPAAPRDAVIARLAYSFAEARGFGPGKELDDWLAAEAHYEALPEGARVAVG